MFVRDYGTSKITSMGLEKKCKKMKRYIYCIFRCLTIKRHQQIYPNLTIKWKMTQTPPRIILIITVDNIRIKLTNGLIWHVNPATSKLYRLYDQTQTLTIHTPTWLARHIWRSRATLFINGSLVLFFFFNFFTMQGSNKSVCKEYLGLFEANWGIITWNIDVKTVSTVVQALGHVSCTIDTDRFVFSFSIISITWVTVLLLQSHTHYNIAMRNIGQNSTFSASEHFNHFY